VFKKGSEADSLKMQMKGQEMIKNLLIAGSGAAFVLSALFATVVFDRVSPNSTLADQEIEMVEIYINIHNSYGI